MKIGIDASMKVNIEEGYTLMEFKQRELMPNGKLNLDAEIRIFAHYPKHVLQEIGINHFLLMYDDIITPKELFEHYLENKESLDSFTGTTYDSLNNEYDVLNLASDIMSYGGFFDPVNSHYMAKG